MGKAARAVIIENDKLLVMYRNKYGSEYFTLIGGRSTEGESLEQTLVREIKEETGLVITKARPVFYEQHPEPYNQQYIYLCEVAPHHDVAIEEASEEATLNKLDANIHKPYWVTTNAFAGLPFRTPQLQAAIVQALKKGFPAQPQKLA